MDLIEAKRLLGLDSSNSYTNRDVEKAFRKQALRHHPDKGGKPSYFELLQRAKIVLLKHNNGGIGIGTTVNGCCMNSTALSSSLYKHRTCVRQVVVVCGENSELLAAATDDGMVIIEIQEHATYFSLAGHERVISCVSYCEDCAFLCCAASPTDTEAIYGGASDGRLYRIELPTRQVTAWQHPSRERIVTISTVRNWVAFATATGGIYVLNYAEDISMPTVVWKAPGIGKSKKAESIKQISPETILLVEVSTSVLNLWVGGGNGNTATGRLLMWELDIGEDFEYIDELEEILWDDSDFEDSETDGDETQKVPAIDVAVEEGPVFSLAKKDRTVAVTAGQCLIKFEYYGGDESFLTKLKTIQTDQTFYTICLNDKFIAAGGSGESILVWDLDFFDLAHEIPSHPGPSGCCLATNCIMALVWTRQEAGILVCGGYDGAVTMWTLARRVEQSKAPAKTSS